MNVRQIGGISIATVSGLVLLTLCWQNRTTDVTLVWLGGEPRTLPLGWALARAFGVGALAGVPLAAGGWLADWWQHRRSQRQVKQLVERLEHTTYAPLPAAMSDPYKVEPKYAREVVGSVPNASEWSDEQSWKDSEPDASDWES